MGDILEPKLIVNALVYSLIGIIVLALAGWIFDKLTPLKAWEEIAVNKNMALAIAVASVMLGLSIIIASAIHG